MSVCNDQQTFNKAVRNAIQHIDDDDDNKQQNQTAKVIVSVIMLVFYLWALLLAMRVTDPQHRVLHIIFALLTGPLYVLSFYLGMMDNKMD
jgi:hypothetical protein